MQYLSTYSYTAATEDWFKKAAAAGSADALFQLGIFQRDQYHNASEMEHLWIKASQGGNKAAQIEIKKLTDERELQAQQAREEAARQVQLTAFKSSIREGDSSHCGPIIEVKANLIKIAFAVANYGNEHWIRRDQLFPAGYDCRFYNGQYQSPQ